MKTLISIFVIATMLSACGQNEKHGNDNGFADKYNINKYFTSEDADSLLVNIVTYIGLKPRSATSKTRFDSEHREYYQNLAPQFSFCYYHIDADSIHYFYIIRPARSIHGNLRAVGGLFKLDSNLWPVDFEESFVTPVYDESLLKEIGEKLFTELINSRNIDKFINDSLYVEWPDGRLFYCNIRHEWRYVD